MWHRLAAVILGGAANRELAVEGRDGGVAWKIQTSAISPMEK